MINRGSKNKLPFLQKNNEDPETKKAKSEAASSLSALMTADLFFPFPQ
jgi:hypothetical protein